jgi:hypothetical protein
MLTKIFSWFIISAMLFTLAGCATAVGTAEQNPGATLGGAAGVATGAILGGAIGGSGTSAVIGGLLGGLAGGVVGHYGYDMSRDQGQTAQTLHYQPSEGNVVNVENISASPGSVRPGDEVLLRTTYDIMSPTPTNTPVTEKWEVTHNGKVVGNPEVRVNRTDGTYNATMPLRLPANAERGTYTVKATIITPNGSASETTQFHVG